MEMGWGNVVFSRKSAFLGFVIPPETHNILRDEVERRERENVGTGPEPIPRLFFASGALFRASLSPLSLFLKLFWQQLNAPNFY